MGLGDIFEKIKDVLTGNDAEEEQRGPDGGVLPASQDPLGDPANEPPQYQQTGGIPSADQGGVLPASQDPLGDPADQERGVLPASQDPLGDPADQGQGVRPASEDPLGDPADR